MVSLIDLMSVHGASVIFQAPGLDLESPERTRHVWALCLLRLPCNRDRVSDKSWLQGVNYNPVKGHEGELLVHTQHGLEFQLVWGLQRSF